MLIKKTLTGGYHLGYSCPHCGDGLSSDIDEAGQQDTCPSCGRAYTVPGQDKVAELKRTLAAEAKAKQDAKAQACADKAGGTPTGGGQNRERGPRRKPS